MAIKDINVKGLDKADGTKLDTNACAIISRTGDVNAEFSGDVYIRETTAKNVNITTRGKNMYIEHLGEVPTYPQDYYGPNGVKLEKAKLTALDLGSYKDIDCVYPACIFEIVHNKINSYNFEWNKKQWEYIQLPNLELKELIRVK